MSSCGDGDGMSWVCIRCEDPVALVYSQPVNAKKPFEARKCNSCSSKDRCLQKVWKGNPSGKDEWKNKRAEEKTLDYKNHKLRKQGSPLDNSTVAVSLKEKKPAYNSVDDIDEYVPFLEVEA